MTTLELRYRRLLRVYPAAHRAVYEEEMLGVLMAGSAPGRRFPTPADAMDLLRSGLTARFGRVFETQRRTGWRDAAAIVALLTAVLLAAIAARRLGQGLQLMGEGDAMRALGVDGLLLLDVAARSVAWSVTAVLALLGRPRATAVMATVAGLVELAAQVGWSVRMRGAFEVPWQLTAVLTAVTCAIVAVRAHSARESLGRRGVALAAVAAGAAVLTGRLNDLMPWWLTGEIWFDRDQSFGLPSPIVLMIGVLLLAALWPAPAPLRRRTIALLAPVAAAAVIRASFYRNYLDTGRYIDQAVLKTALMLAVTAAAFAVGVAVVRRRERATIR
ncbi:hypothetical protein [Actinoplanes regularis]|uniref:hypothetical protein n=1 Tax=Actinoplanes regularis TaxID=52697 RepID=UPI0024A4727C|nr:hypothetical protein [Actinoplanes regularis]GLW29789.1 hypothetical protein Areg01_27290 [Actinoplanes regularis]